jgi:hypothetical protein
LFEDVEDSIAANAVVNRMDIDQRQKYILEMSLLYPQQITGWQKMMRNPGFKEGSYIVGDTQIKATKDTVDFLFPMEIDCPDSVIYFVLNGSKKYKVCVVLKEVEGRLSGQAHNCPVLYSNNIWDIK